MNPLIKKFQPIKIGRHLVGPGYPTYIIFEIASTHSNNWDIAKDYIKLAKEAGADALKFQLFNADKLLNPISSLLLPIYNYFKNSETPREWFPKLLNLCKKEGLDLLCTPFDEDSADFLNKIGIPAIKIASGDLTNHKLLSNVAKFGKPIILSTGMATMDEVEKAVKLLEDAGCNQYIILQCTSVYPMPYEAANLKVIQTLANEFKTVVGFSDNGSKGYIAPLAAVALGASVIEKHVTSQKKRKNMDDIFSLSVEEFAEMVKRIREAKSLSDLKKEFKQDFDKLLGDGIKRPTKIGYLRKDGTYMSEDLERHWARRGIYPRVNIAKGNIIIPEMLIALRPDVGISTIDYVKVIGLKAKEDLPKRYSIKLEKGGVRKFRKSDIQSSYPLEQDKEFIKILSETALFE